MITKYSIYGLLFQALFLNLVLANTGRAQKNISVREVKVELNSDDLTVNDIIKQIEEKSNFRFAIDGITSTWFFHLLRPCSLRFCKVSKNVLILPIGI